MKHLIKVCDIAKAIERIAPLELAQSWDNSGLLIGDSEREVKSVMVMLDADVNTIKEAVEEDVDMIVTHHPLFIEPLRSVTDNKILTLIENKIALYSAHTNMDVAKCGVNDALAAKLGLMNVREVTLGDLPTRMGDVEPCSLLQFISLVKTTLGIKKVRYVGDLTKEIKTAVILGGSGADLYKEAKASGADVYVTADLKYHIAQGADEIGMCMVDAGHYETERCIGQRLVDYLEEQFPELTVLKSKRNESYIKYE